MAINDSIREYPGDPNAGALTAGLLKQVLEEAVIKTSTGDQELATLEKIYQLMLGFRNDLGKDMDRLRDSVKDHSEYMSSVMGRPADQKARNRAVESQTESLKKLVSATEKMNTSLGEMGQKSGKVGGGKGIAGGGITGLIGAGLVGGAKRFTKVMDDFGISLRSMTKGVVKDSIQWNTNMRAVLYSVEGAGTAMTETENKFLKLGKVSYQTGMDRIRTQENYLKQFKHGFTMEMKSGKLQKRTAQDLNRLVNNSLKTANVLGSSADSTVDLFAEWNRSLGLSNTQLSNMGRSMEQIAQVTGVTGDNLIQAAKTANQVIKSVRDFSGIGDEAMASIIQVQASLTKFGAEDLGGRVVQAMSRGWESLRAADPAIQSLLSGAMQKNGIMPGEAITKDPVKMRKVFADFNKNLGGLVKQISGGALTEDLTTLTEQLEELELTNPRLAAYVENVMNELKIPAGQVEAMARAAQEDMDPDKRMKQLNEQLNAATTQFQKDTLNQKINDLGMSTNRAKLGQFQTFAEKTGNFDAALERYNKKAVRGGGQAISGADAVEMSRKALNDLVRKGDTVGVDVEDILKEKGLSFNELAEGVIGKAGSDVASYSAIMDEIGNAIQTKERAKQDPILEIQLDLLKINDAMKMGIENMASSLLTTNRLLLAILAALTVKGIASALGTGGMLNALKGAGKWGLKGLMGAGKFGLKGLMGAGRMGLSGMRGLAGLLGGGGGGAAAGGAGWLGRGAGMAGKGLGLLAPLIGGVRGALGAKENGRGLLSGTLLGVLTGDASTGSNFSEMLGIDKGSGADEALGVLGAGAHGAATGAAIGSFIPVVGTAIGGIIGGVIGSGAELAKLITSPESKLRKTLDGWGAAIKDGVSEIVGGMWDGVKGFATDLWDSAKDAAGYVSDLFTKGSDEKGGSFVGDLTNATKDAVSTAYENVSGFVGGAYEKVSGFVGGAVDRASAVFEDVGDFFSDISPFALGTDFVKQSGLGMLHKGEMVVPSEQVEAAQGNGPFGTSSVTNQGLFAAGLGKEANDSALHRAMETGALGMLHPEQKAESKAAIFNNPALRGYFPQQKTARELVDNPGLSGFFPKGTVSAANEGVFSPENVHDTARSYLNSMTNTDLNNLYESSRSQSRGDTSTSRALYLSEDQNYANLESSLSNAYSSNNTASPTINPTMMDADAAQDFVASQVEASKPTGANSLSPGIDNLGDKLDQIIMQNAEVLYELREMRRSQSTSMTLPAELGGAVPSTDKSGVRNWSKDRLRGHLTGLQYGAYSDMNNFTGEGSTF